MFHLSFRQNNSNVFEVGYRKKGIIRFESFCFLSLDKDYKFAIIRVSRSNQRFDNNAVQNIKNAWASGMRYVHGYIFVNGRIGEPSALVRQNLDFHFDETYQLFIGIEYSKHFE